MSRTFIIVLYVAVAVSVASCRRETPQPQATGTGPTTTSTALAGDPQDLSNAKIKTAIAPDTAIYVTNFRVGPAVGGDGLVTEEKSEFAPDETVYLSMWLKESPTGLQTSATIEDSAGKEVDVERKAMKGEKTVTFALGDKKLKAGTYKLTGYWGGNIAAEHEVTVVRRAPAKASKAKGKAKATSP